MEEFVAYIVKNLVSHPDDVSVSCRTADNTVTVDLSVSPDDLGQVIGRKGKTIQALRTVVSTVAARLGYRSRVELVTEEEDDEENEE